MDVRDLDGERLATEAVEGALRSRGPSALEAGQYEVVLDAHAVQDIVDFVASLGFTALAVQEAPASSPASWARKWWATTSASGTTAPTRAACRCRLTSKGAQATGRYAQAGRGDGNWCMIPIPRQGGQGVDRTRLPAPNTYGPLALNVFMQAGNAKVEDMIRSTKRGCSSPASTTRAPSSPARGRHGMTRDGTWLIEDGKLGRPVRNLRLHQSYWKPSRKWKPSPRHAPGQGRLRAFRVPAIKVSQFNFTGVTEF